MKKIAIIIICILLIVESTICVLADELTYIPDLPMVFQKHYAIYREGNRDNRIEVTFFDISDNSDQSLILERPYQLTLFGNRETDNNEIVPRPMTSLTPLP